MPKARLLAPLLIVAGLSLIGVAGDRNSAMAVPIVQPAGPLSRTPVGTWVTDSSVETIVAAGDTVFAGGFIGYVGARTGALGVFDRNFRLRPGMPQVFGGDPVAGFVTAVAPDGAGGWIVGGSFTEVSGRSCRGIARVTAANTLDPRFCLAPNGLVTSIAVKGRTAYFGGEFTSVNGKRRLRAAAIDLASGRLLRWAPAVAGGPYDDRSDVIPPSVNALAVRDGVVFIGGLFDSVGSRPRARIAAVDSVTGAPLEWRADTSRRERWFLVRQLAVVGQTLYVLQSTLGDDAVPDVRALDVSSARVLEWRAPVRRVHALLATRKYVYLATAAGESSRVVAADPRTGSVAGAFRAPLVTGTVRALATTGRRVVVVGEFGRVGRAQRANVAAFDATTGRTLRWAPRTNAPVHAVASSSGSIALGGTMTSIGGVARDSLVAFDGKTGTVLPWSPRIDGVVKSVAVDAGRLFIGGDFVGVDGVARSGLAAFDLESKQLLDWAPSVAPSAEISLVHAVAAANGCVYVAGDFDHVNGVRRERLAAIDAVTGEIADWDPGLTADGVEDLVEIKEIEIVGDRVYVAGDFTRVADVRHVSLLEITADSGEVTDWAPGQDGLYGVSTIAAGGDSLYVGGDFGHFDGAPRHGLASVDRTSHALLEWSPTLALSWVAEIANDLAVVGDRIVVAGDFRSINGVSRRAIALLDRISGAVDEWQPPAAQRAQYAADAVAASSTLLAFDGSVGGNADSISLYRFGD